MPQQCNILLKITLYALALLCCQCHPRDKNRPAVPVFSTPKHLKAPTLSQGLAGQCIYYQGPALIVSPDSISAKQIPVKRELLVYEPLPADFGIPVKGLFLYRENLPQKLLYIIKSNDKGFFQAPLPPGNYSLLTVEKDKLYANWTHVRGVLGGIRITDSLSYQKITLTYELTF